jgi:hypothetical protein
MARMENVGGRDDDPGRLTNRFFNPCFRKRTSIDMAAWYQGLGAFTTKSDRSGADESAWHIAPGLL